MITKQKPSQVSSQTSTFMWQWQPQALDASNTRMLEQANIN